MVVRSSVNLESRRQALAELLSSSGSLRIEDLAARFEVSTMTIRRDLQALEDEGLVRRVRGGAISSAQPFEARKTRAGRAKEEIARKLMSLVPSGGVGICMDASSTLSVLAGSMPPAENLSVVTDGIETFLTLTRNPRLHAYLTGGQKDPNAGSLIGPVASLALKQFSFARAFLSAAAVDPHFGTSEFSAEECEIKRLMAELSDHVVMAVDSQKLGTGAAARCLPWDGIDLMVTELNVSDDRLDPYRDHVELL
ncbi:DeoR/GlpR family DNA-binding transcription regulator [Nonomuraea sp. NPDC049784]|uniref:DeoR/GlpR family DNA-binding transcription regulator n=1 Tax=Nonomuraea sp. NPDC049784 TaxID=3154361 RepID=UPI0033F9FF53